MKEKILFIPLILFMLASSACRKHSCSDGILNGEEVKIDCGGECGPCPGCQDGIRNQSEHDIDCGGPCDPCGTCSDGIKNQGEMDIDCGGPCAACPSPVFRATINGIPMVASMVSASDVGWGLYIQGSRGDQFISITHTGARLTGTYPLNVRNVYLEGSDTCVGTLGVISFTRFDTVRRVLSGSFSFQCGVNGQVSEISGGSFSNVGY